MSTSVWRVIVASTFGLGFVAVAIMAYVLFASLQERPLPFRYEDTTPAGVYPRDLCPNEPLQFDLSVVVARAPSVVLVVENWQRVTGGAIPDLSPTYHIQESPKVGGGRQSIPIPNLDPGGWVYERAATVNTVDHPTLLQIPFTVRADCPQVGSDATAG